MVELIKEISLIPSAPGKEKHMVQYLQQKLENLFDTYFCDGLSNIVFHKKGSGENVVFLCHTDHQGVIATFTQNSKTNISPLGKPCAKLLVGTKINFFSGKKAFIASEKKTEDIKTVSDLYALCDDSENPIQSGDIGYIPSDISTFGKDLVCGANLSCILPLFTLIQSAQEIINKANDKNIYFVFCSQSNLGGRGAVCALSGISADTIYNIRCIDAPLGSPQGAKGVSSGICFALCSKGFVSSPEVLSGAMQKCKDNDIPFSTSNDDETVSDISFASKSGKGAPGIDICIPLYNIHTLSETASLSDLNNLTKLLPVLV